MLGEVGQGWSVAMATTSSERGLTLRSPGRFTATADDSSRSSRNEVHQHTCATVRSRLTKAEAYRVQTLDVVTRTVQGRPPGAETSFVKLWWSELDIELHELALDLLGADAELESGWSKGWQFSLSGPIYAGTNEIQRNIAAERVLGLPAPMHFAFDEEQLAFRDAVRDLLAKHCPPEVVRAAWDAAPGSLDRGAWTALAEMGVLTVLVPDDIGGLGLDERSLVLLLEEAGYAGLPHPLVESAAVAMPLADDRLSGSELVATDLAGPHVCCAADADHLLLQTTSGALRSVPRDEVSVEPVDAVDHARRLGRVSWKPTDATFLTDDRAELLNAFDRGASAPPRRLSAWPNGCSTSRSPTRPSANSSVRRSAPFRPSNTTLPTPPRASPSLARPSTAVMVAGCRTAD